MQIWPENEDNGLEDNAIFQHDPMIKNDVQSERILTVHD